MATSKIWSIALAVVGRNLI